MAGDDALELLLLGPFEVRRAGSRVEVGGRKQRAVLAMLALSPGRVVTRERLVDGLWGDRPPASAAKSIQIYVSNLRKRLGDTGIVTYPGGYGLAAEPEAVDAERFEQLVAEARRLAAAGDAAAAAGRLRSALALWRGPALADLVDEPFAAVAVPPLEELRLAALEERIEAELALGEHEALVPELGRLVREHPLRERLRGHLMLALYASGRQADALAAYRDARRALRDELGLEPSPTLAQLERAILEHDPALVGERRRPRPARGNRRRLALVALAGAALVSAAASAAWLASSRAGSAAVEHAPANSLALIDPSGNELAGYVPLGGTPGAVAVGDGAVWVANLQDEVVARVDPRSRAVTRTFAVGAAPEGVAAGGGAVWVASASRDEIVRIGHRRDRIHRVRLGGRELRPCSSAELPALQTRFPLPLFIADLVALPDAVWFVCATHALARAQPTGGAELVEYEGRLPVAIAHGLGSLWIANLDGDTVAQVDEASGDTLATYTVPGGPSGVAVGGGSVWVTACALDAVWRIVPERGRRAARTIESIPVGHAPMDVAWGAGAVWVANSGDGTVSRVDPRAGEVVATVEIGQRPHALAVGAGFTWVTVQAAVPWKRGCVYP